MFYKKILTLKYKGLMKTQLLARPITKAYAKICTKILKVKCYTTYTIWHENLNEVYIAYLNQVNAGAAYEFVEH